MLVPSSFDVDAIQAMINERHAEFIRDAIQAGFSDTQAEFLYRRYGAQRVSPFGF